MAQQIINIGSAPNDGTGDPLRDGFDKANDNFTELYTRVGDNETDIAQNAADIAVLQGTADITQYIRSGQASANGAVGQTINFSSPLSSANYALILIDNNGLGLQWSSKNTSGFILDSLTAGNFEYIAILFI